MIETPEVVARETLVDWLRKYLVGPCRGMDERLHAGERRVYSDGRTRDDLQQRPSDFYHTGFLSPGNVDLDAEEDDQEDQGNGPDEGTGEAVMTLANAAKQSAMGLTFQTSDPEAQVDIAASWGEYELLAEEEKQKPIEKASHGAVATVPLVWKRTHHRLTGKARVSDLPEGSDRPVASERGIRLLARRRRRKNLEFVTVSLVNGRQENLDGARDQCIFQAQVKVDAVGGKDVFVHSTVTARRTEGDFWKQELLFRHARQFAVGHGCAVMWDTRHTARAVGAIRTEWVPECEVPKASAVDMGAQEALDVEWLADTADDKALLNALQVIPTCYRTWIDEQKAAVEDIVTEFPEDVHENIRRAATEMLEDCAEQRGRIAAGIRYLKEHVDALEAFRLANRSMAFAMKKTRPEKTPRWRLFQLAFILVALPSATERDHPERDVLDLIWFPTGGGKTEAYLGLTAYVIFQRGLCAPNSVAAAGTVVLTRYTLRLLTVQQFERAALTLLACEHVRRTHPRLRECEPYSIGLLVGKRATPNSIKEAEALQAKGDDSDSSQTLLPLEECPWCGTTLTSTCLSFEDRAMTTGCPSSDCEFKGNIPLAVIDEQILATPPTFVIATIDKLAQMPWAPEQGHLFGAGGASHSPPDLIIQDELHLIGDSLGTIAALYETAVDWLCSREGRGPKIIGSTATIRRAAEQTEKLFQRRTLQFPPNGTDAGNSFFYTEDQIHPGRLYLGIHAQGRSPKHTLARVMGTLLQAADNLEPPEVRDAFYTLVAYFNSLRELGGAFVTAEDDVPRYMKNLQDTAGVKPRNIVQKVELTSLVPSKRIPELLKQLEVASHVYQDAHEPLDLVLCTNMISVGVDVDRLGLMVVNGQPKTTAEYIQASSRIGRPAGTAGLVVIQYNWTRARDRSHYERFLGYHGAFYRYVEAVSVTPFSGRARDRALRSLFVSLVRIGVPKFAANESAGEIEEGTDAWEQVRSLIDVVVTRVKAVDADEAEDTEHDLQDILCEWVEAAGKAREMNKTLYWTPWVPGGASKLTPQQRRTGQFMLQATGMAGEEGRWDSMLSMRDVDPPAPLRLWTGGDASPPVAP